MTRAVMEYVGRLWGGQVPLARAFWLHMLAVGTLVNLAALIAAMLLFAAHVPTWVAIATFLSPLPYNGLLFMAVWRSAAKEATQWSWPAQVVAALWLVVASTI